MVEQEPIGRIQETDLEQSDLKSRLRVIQGGVTESYPTSMIREPSRGNTFDNDFGLPASDLDPFIMKGDSGITTIVPANKRKFY